MSLGHSKLSVNHDLPYVRYNTATGTDKNPGVLTNDTLSPINTSEECRISSGNIEKS